MTIRIFCKALGVVILLNFICLAMNVNPVTVLTRFNTWWLVGHGRARLAYRSDFKNGQLPIEALLAAHEVAYRPKAADEFRVFIMGNSGPWGATLSDDETLSAQLTALHLPIHGKRLVAYNLAYPGGSILESILILDGAVQYQPDLIILFVAGGSFSNSSSMFDNNAFLALNRSRLIGLADTFKLRDWLNERAPPIPFSSSWLAIRDDGTLAVWLGSLFYPFVPPDLGQTSQRIAREPIPDKPNNFEDVPGIYPMPNDAWRFLLVGQQLADKAHAKFLVINQPTLVLSDRPQSTISYSRLYGRVFYDQHREVLSRYARQHRLWYIDLWNVVPPDRFTDSELHFDDAGWAIVADLIGTEIKRKFAR